MRRGALRAVYSLLLLAVAGFWPSAGVTAESHSPLLFPMVIEPASVTEATGAEVTLLDQALRPIGAARIEKDMPIHFQASVNYAPGVPPSWDLVIPRGTVFIAAISQDKVYYCESKSIRDAWLYHYDVGICLLDADRDGVFDQVLAVDDGVHRIRSPLEIKHIDGATVQTVAVPYGKMKDDEVPKLHLLLKYHFVRALLHSSGRVSAEICWPASLPLPAEDVTTDITCGFTDWATGDMRQAARLLSTFELRQGAGEQGAVKLGPISFSLSLDKDHAITAHVTPLPAGRGVIYDRGETFIGNDYRDEQSVLHLQVLDTGPDARGKI